MRYADGSNVRMRADGAGAHVARRSDTRPGRGPSATRRPEDLAVVVDRDIDVGVLVARVTRRRDVLAPALDPLHRPTRATAAAATATSSWRTQAFCPNDPPMSSLTTRTECTGRWSKRANVSRTS